MTTSWMHAWLWILPLSALCACGPGVEEGPVPGDSETEPSGGTESPDAGADSETATSEIPDAGDTDSASDVSYEWCRYPTIEDQDALSASFVLAGSEIAAIGGNCALVSRPEASGYTAAVAFMSAYADNNTLATVQGTVSLPPRAVTCRFDPLTKIYTAYVLTSDDTSSELFEVQDESATWTSVFAGPSLSGVHLMLRTAAPSLDEVCVFGDGFYCAPRTSLPLEWREEPVSASGERVLDTALFNCESGWCMVAVGESGEVRVLSDLGWERLETGSNADLVSVSDNGDFFTAVGASGTMVHGNASGVQTFTILDGRDLAAVDWMDDRFFMGATADGTVFEGEIRSNGVFLCPGPDSVEGPVLDAMFFDCDGERNYLAACPDRVFGRYECTAVVVI